MNDKSLMLHGPAVGRQTKGSSSQAVAEQCIVSLTLMGSTVEAHKLETQYP